MTESASIRPTKPLQVLLLLSTVLLSAWLATAQAGAAPAGFDAEKPTVLITGSNRGIGLGLARHYAADGWNVIATARNPDKADELQQLAATYPAFHIAVLDVTDLDQIQRLAADLDAVAIDVLINNAGVLGDLEGQQFGSFDFEQFAWTMAVNVYGPMAMAEAFKNHVAASQQKKIVTLTSGLGSLTLMGRMQGMTYYRVSKAGINMGMRAIRASLRPEGIVVALVAPGMVETQLLADSGYRGKALSPAESAAGMAEIIAGLTLEDDGTPTNVDGKTIPW